MLLLLDNEEYLLEPYMNQDLFNKKQREEQIERETRGIIGDSFEPDMSVDYKLFDLTLKQPSIDQINLLLGYLNMYNIDTIFYIIL